LLQKFCETEFTNLAAQIKDIRMNTTSQLPERKEYQKIIDNKPTDLYVLKNKNGMIAAVTNYGGRLVSLIVPDKNGVPVDVVVGFNSVEEFKNCPEPYYGATIGRYANRIAKGKFILDGREYSLALNNGPNHLHGGPKGFHNVVWEAEQLDEKNVLLTYLSVDGEEGYPGNLNVELLYSLTDENELKLNFKAATDKTTIINLTNHAYFNLNGQGSGSILNHLLEINADHFTPIDATSIPTGVLQPVSDSAFDFRHPIAIGSRINEDDIQLKNGIGYDHNFVLNKKPGEKLDFAARAVGDATGIVMEVYTEEPGLQLYSGNFMKGKNKIKGGATDDYRTAFCLETQHFPDSPNHPSFPSGILEPEDVYRTESVFRFGVRQA
jgi:aldose 1-epimerase